MGLVKVEVLTGPQGGGKSTVMREEAIQKGGLYLFALPTIELLEEQAAAFSRARPSLTIAKVHKDSGSGSVGKRLLAARQHFADHGVTDGMIFTTHETLMSNTVSDFAGWHARIDEAPAAVQAGQFNIAVARRPWLRETFDIVGAAGSEWSMLALKAAKPNYKEVERDEGASALGEFIKQASQPERVFVRATSWDDRDDIDWFSMWTPLELAGFASVQIAGSSYTDSVGYRAARALFEDLLTFSEREVNPPRIKQPSISIAYFTKAHEGSTTFWGTSEGRLCIKLVCDHLGSALSDTAYWSGNEVVQHLMEHRLPGTLIKPMAMGINKHRQARDCAFVFSSKATPDDKPLKSVFGLTDDDIRRAREDDAIAQFAMRGAIRDLDFDRDYTIYLYSQSQAERLRDHLLRIGFTTVTLLELEDAGLMEMARPAPVKAEPTAEEREARRARRAEAAKLRAQRNRDRKKQAKRAATLTGKSE